MKNKRLDSLLTYTLGIGGALLILFVSVLMIKGIAWIGENILQGLVNLATIVFYANLYISLPLLLFRKTRGIGGSAIYISSYVFFWTLWFLGITLTYSAWGVVGVFVGFLLGGIGVIPVAMLAMLLFADFFAFWTLIVLTAITVGAWSFGYYLLNKRYPLY